MTDFKKLRVLTNALFAQMVLSVAPVLRKFFWPFRMFSVTWNG